MSLSDFTREWTRLNQIAEHIEEGDSLAELVENLIAARTEFPMPASGQCDHPAFVVARFVDAVMTTLVWERFGIDHHNRRQALGLYRAALARGKPAEYRLMDDRFTEDERNTLALLTAQAAERGDAAD